MKCNNCASSNLELLCSIDSSKASVVTSDAQLIDEVKAARTLCGQCGCIEVHYTPEDRLKRYFKDDYDISDEVQDNLIVCDNKAVGKHSHIVSSLFSGLKGLGESGSFLEIACGRGKLTNLFQEKYPGWGCVGIDPSVDAPGEAPRAAAEARAGSPTFIKGYFEEKYFDGTTFDLIVAHGFLNRSPVLPELQKMRGLSTEGTLLSIEVCILENSVFAPHIWDHPFQYKGEVFELYLNQLGYTLISKTYCVSSYHFIFRCDAPPKPIGEISIDKGIVSETEKLYREHLQWWVDVKKNYDIAISSGDTSKRYALFGAGLYSAVLMSMLKENGLKLVVDEVKSGSVFFNLPVVGLNEAVDIDGCHVLLCIRPDYVEHIVAKLKDKNLPCSVLNP